MYIKCKERKYHLQFTILSLSMSGKKNLHGCGTIEASRYTIMAMGRYWVWVGAGRHVCYVAI